MARGDVTSPRQVHPKDIYAPGDSQGRSTTRGQIGTLKEATGSMTKRDDMTTHRPLASVTEGSRGEVFVGLHGWNGSCHTFDALGVRRPADRRFVSLDLPGYGRSPAPERWELEEVAAQVVATIDAAVGAAPVSLVGSCSGGVVGLFVAGLLGARLDRFIFLEPFAFVPDYLRVFLTPVVGRLFYYSAFGNPVGRRITNAALADHRGADTDMMASFGRGSLEVPLKYLHLFDDIGGPERFAALPGRIELVWGEHTFEAIRDSVQIWSRVWPNAQCVEIAGAGHLLLEEAPDQIAAHVFAPE